jgi:hypothetical protein
MATASVNSLGERDHPSRLHAVGVRAADRQEWIADIERRVDADDDVAVIQATANAHPHASI